MTTGAWPVPAKWWSWRNRRMELELIYQLGQIQFMAWFLADMNMLFLAKDYSLSMVASTCLRPWCAIFVGRTSLFCPSLADTWFRHFSDPQVCPTLRCWESHCEQQPGGLAQAMCAPTYLANSANGSGLAFLALFEFWISPQRPVDLRTSPGIKSCLSRYCMWFVLASWRNQTQTWGQSGWRGAVWHIHAYPVWSTPELFCSSQN